LQVDAESSEDTGYAAAQELMRRKRPFDAVFAASDLIAMGAMRALTEAGTRIPQDVSVVGFDDIPGSRFTAPPLTTIRQDTVRAGELLVESLIALVDGKTPASQRLATELVLRRSSSPDAV